MHFGKSNPKAIYCMTDVLGNELNKEKMRVERDLGVIVGDYFK